MNPREYSVVFSILLASTLVHEIRAKGSPNSIFGHYRNKRNVESNNYPPSCQITCDNSIPQVDDDYQFPSLLAFEEIGMLAIARLKHGLGLVIDLQARMFGLILAVSGEAVLVSVGTGTGYYLPEASFGNITDFEKIFFSFTDGLGIPFPDSTPFEISTAPDNACNLVNKIIPLLVEGVEDQCEADRMTGLNYLSAYFNDLIPALSGNLVGLLKLLDRKIITLPVDLNGFLTFCHGLSTFVGTVTGDLSTLCNEGVVIDIEELLSSKNGLDSFCDMINTIGDKVDWSHGLGPYLNSPDTMFKLMAEFDLPNGMFKIMTNIVSFIQGKIPLESMILVIIHCLTLPNTHPIEYDLPAAMVNSMTKFIGALERVKATQALSRCIFMLRSLTDENLVIDGVNISSILRLLRTRKPGVPLKVPEILELMVQILYHLRPIVDISESFPKLIVVLLVGSKTPTNVILLKRLGLHPKDLMPAHIMKNETNYIFSKPMVSGYYMGDLYRFLSSLSGIGQLFDILFSVFLKVTGINAREILNSSNSMELLRACFQVCSGHNMDARPELIVTIKIVQKACADFRINWKITLPVKRY